MIAENHDVIVPVILCGGSGTRLWPASREQHPKQFLNLMGKQSLLQQTMHRALRITRVNAGNIVTVTLGTLAEGVKKQLGAAEEAARKHILSEPCARNTAAAVALSALYVNKEFGANAFMWVLPADHHMGDEAALAQAFMEGLKAARQGSLVTFGIQPTRPDTGYGYIKVGAALDDQKVFSVEKFVEKPDLKTAQSYLDEGMYLWNSGMFLFRAGDILEQFRLHAPDILKSTEKAVGSGTDTIPDAELYGSIPEQPFDKAIMEKSGDVVVVPCDPKWSDVGSWESLWDISNKDSDNNVVTGRVIGFANHGSFIQGNGKRLIACAGLKNIIVVDTGDAILIADKSNADAMKGLVKAIKAAGCEEAIVPPPEEINKD